jgi:hypothetical protein
MRRPRQGLDNELIVRPKYFRKSQSRVPNTIRLRDLRCDERLDGMLKAIPEKLRSSGESLDRGHCLNRASASAPRVQCLRNAPRSLLLRAQRSLKKHNLNHGAQFLHRAVQASAFFPTSITRSPQGWLQPERASVDAREGFGDLNRASR